MPSYRVLYGLDRFLEEPLPADTCASCGYDTSLLESTVAERLRAGVPLEGEHDFWLGYLPGTVHLLVYTCPCCGRRQEFMLD